MAAWLWVGLGGALGSMLRYAIGLWLNQQGNGAFPLGTFAVNIVGSFLIALVYGLAMQGQLHANWRLFLTTGFCGGFTTFSTFSYENMQLLQSGAWGQFGLYTGLSVACGLLAAAGGLALGTAMAK